MPVNPATQEAEQETSLNPEGRECDDLRSHHCPQARAMRAKLGLKRKKKSYKVTQISLNTTLVVNDYWSTIKKMDYSEQRLRVQ